MGPLGWQETVFIFILALLIFGPRKLPELGRTLGKAIQEFRRASNELKATWDRELRAIEQETRAIEEETRRVGTEIASSYYDSSYGYYDDYEYPYEERYTYETSSSQTTTQVETQSTVADNGSQLGGEQVTELASAGETIPERPVGSEVEAVDEPRQDLTGVASGNSGGPAQV